MPGAGKTTVARELEQLLQLHWIDIDAWIEQEEQSSISNIVTRYGFERFRHLEAEYLRKLYTKGACLVSTGGGCPKYHNNIEYMNRFGITIWVNTEDEEIIENLKKDRDKRPATKGMSDEDIEDYVRRRHEEMDKFYQQCQYEVTFPIGLTPREQASRIKDVLCHFRFNEI